VLVEEIGTESCSLALLADSLWGKPNSTGSSPKAWDLQNLRSPDYVRMFMSEMCKHDSNLNLTEALSLHAELNKARH
jgi:hypothetical protein